MTALRTEADVVRELQGAVTVSDIYAACENGADIERGNGLAPVEGGRHGSDVVWRRRARGALQNLRRQGRARRIGDGTWLLNAPSSRATVFLLISADAELRDVELRVSAACELLASLDVDVDLVLTDPPWALGRDEGEPERRLHHCRRDHSRVVRGYRDVRPEAYREFSAAWVGAAARVLRPGAQLAVVTGPQRAAHVQLAAEDAGLTYIASISAARAFALYCQRRPAAAHYTVTVMAAGGLYEPARVFNPPEWQLSRSGRPYPLDVFPLSGRADRRGERLRYDNALPSLLVDRLLAAFSNPGHLVCDPFLGSGTVLLACLRGQRRFVGGDVNANAVRFAAARLLAENRELLANGEALAVAA
jgi:DNA modification methylase